MRIDALSGQPDRAGRYLVTFSDSSVLRLYRQTVEDFGLYVGLELSPEQMTALRAAAQQMSAKMRAVRIVAASNVSKSDLEQRLVRKGESPQYAKEALYIHCDLPLNSCKAREQDIFFRHKPRFLTAYRKRDNGSLR